MSIKISELPEATSVNPSDLIPIVQDGTTKKATESMINSVNYSTTEYVVGTWINGKPLYEKTYEITSLPQVTTDGTGVSVSTNIDTGIDFAFIVNMQAISSTATYPNIQPMPYLNNAGYQFKGQITKVQGVNRFCIAIVSTGTAFNSYIKAIVTIRYTKTTDTATRSINLTRGISGDEELQEKVEEQLLTPVEDEKELKKDILDDKEELKKADIEDIDIKSENIESGDKLEDVSDEQANKPTDI